MHARREAAVAAAHSFRSSICWRHRRAKEQQQHLQTQAVAHLEEGGGAALQLRREVVARGGGRGQVLRDQHADKLPRQLLALRPRRQLPQAQSPQRCVALYYMT